MRALSKVERRALLNLLTIFHLTFYDKTMRELIEELRELIRKNTLDPKHNKCDFDLTPQEKILSRK